jgi:metal-responsive CopG/Arc/MetJ family transcriptional regulator
MKTAISIPDPIFQAAEAMAKRLEMSRSELFTVAVSKYMKDNKYQDVTETLNKLYSNENSNLDTELSVMQFKSISKEAW